MKRLTCRCCLAVLLTAAALTTGAQQGRPGSWIKDDHNALWVIPSRGVDEGTRVRLQWYAEGILRVTVFPGGLAAGRTAGGDGAVGASDGKWMGTGVTGADFGGAGEANRRAVGDTSLCVTAAPDAKLAYDVHAEGDSVYAVTDRLRLAVSLVTGRVSFAGAGKGPLLREMGTEGRFTGATADGQPCYAIADRFEGTADDAWYGLGQHQDDQYNYRNRQVRFFQNNTSVAIPFLLSRKKYGILWDNSSLSTVGDTRPFQPLSTLRLFNADGVEGWLTQRFANDKAHPDRLLTSRAVSAIDIAYLGDSKIAFPAGFTAASGLVYYEGAIASGVGGIHKFDLSYAGYVKLWIDGRLVLDRWRQAWNPGAGVVETTMEAGKKYSFKIEWLPDGGESYLTCKWLPPVPAGLQNSIGFSSAAAHTIDYYFIAGDDMDGVVSGYRQLTGKAVLMPKWAFGFWQSRERYKTQAELLGVVQEFRKRGIPLDNIVQDWSYWKEKEWGSQEFDVARFPSPDSMIAALHDRYHAQCMISVWPKFYTGISNYDSFYKRGWLYGRNVADSQRDWINAGYVSTFYDAFNGGARQGFWRLLNDKLYKKGIDAWWMDASEPDILSNVSPEKRIAEMTPTALGPAALWLNAYPLENARGIYEGQRSTGDNKRVFLLTRSGFAGSQRYAAAIWSGDIASRWYDMKAQITAGLNFSMSGLPYWTMDIGGFSVERRYERPNAADEEEWRELQTRWYQFGAFAPIFRVHGQYPFREIYNIAPQSHPAYQSMLYYDRLRYRLMPYIYSLAGNAYLHDYTLMRGLVMDFPGDTAVTNIGDEYMFGPSLLINPVYHYKTRERSVYLPAGTGWYNFYDGTFQEGGRYISADAPYARMPVFVRAGSIIPAGPALQYVAEKPADTLTLYVYPGKDAGFEIYEDQGTNYDYEKGGYSIIPLRYEEATGALTIGARTGSFKGMLQQRVIRVIWVGKGLGFEDPGAGRGPAGAAGTNAGANTDAGKDRADANNDAARGEGRRADRIIRYSGKEITIKRK